MTGDTTGSLDFSVVLPEREFFQGQFVLVRSVGGREPDNVCIGGPTSGTIGPDSWNWATPFSAGSFTPAPGADFPGPYADLVQCTTAGSICGTELNFTASGADATHPFVIDAPRGAGNFLNLPVPFVANLSIAPNTALCPEDTAS